MGRPKVVDYWRAEAGRDNGFTKNLRSTRFAG